MQLNLKLNIFIVFFPGICYYYMFYMFYLSVFLNQWWCWKNNSISGMDKNRPALTWSPFLPGQTYVVSLADNCQIHGKIIEEHSFFRTHGTMYSRMNQVKFVEDSFWKFEMIWSVLTDHITSNFLNGVFHKFYLVHSWIPCLTCEWLLLVFKNFSYQLGDKTEKWHLLLSQHVQKLLIRVSIQSPF